MWRLLWLLLCSLLRGLLSCTLLIFAVSIPVVLLFPRLRLRFWFLVRLDRYVNRRVRWLFGFLLGLREFLGLFLRLFTTNFIGVRRLVSARLARLLFLWLPSVELVLELVLRLPDDLRLLWFALVWPHFLVAVLIVVRLSWPILVIGATIRVSTLKRIKPSEHLY